jgi:hypothetical protein
MNITTTNLTRTAGVSAVLSGLLFIMIQRLRPPVGVSTVTAGAWAAVAYMTMAMAVPNLAGVPELYLRQLKERGVPGLIGYLGETQRFTVPVPR